MALVLLAPSTAWSYAPAPVRNDTPRPLVEVRGAATVRDARVSVRCATQTFVTRESHCTLRATFELVADDELSVTVSPIATTRFDDAPAARERTLAAGLHTRVTVETGVDVTTHARLRNGPWILPPMVVRHPLFGDSEGLVQEDGTNERIVVGGPAVTVTGPVLDAQGDGVRITARATEGTRPAHRTVDHASIERRLHVAMVLPARHTAVGPMRLGGPVLAGGARFRWDPSEHARATLRVGYEVSLWEYGFLHTAVETDFESLFESLTLDIASPNVLLIIPSFRAGAGVVFRQLGHRDPDLAVRLRAGANLFPGGLDVDADWWPSLNAWTLSLTGRIGL